VVPLGDDYRYLVYALIGYPSMVLGFVCLAPLAVLGAERFLAPLLAPLLRIDRRFLAAQLSGNLWRTIGTTVALTVGLGLYVSTQTWGYSMLKPFTPGDWLPDMIVGFPSGLSDDQLMAVRKTPGVAADQCLPMVVEQPKLASDLLGAEKVFSAVRQDNVLLVGVDPEQAFGGEHPLFHMDFKEGSPADAVARLKQGRQCIVPDHFVKYSGLGVGDRFAVLPPDNPDQPVEYTIAGVVTLPGWHWMSKLSGMRSQGGRSGAMIFANFDQVRSDFNLQKTRFLWLNTDGAASKEQLQASFQAIAETSVPPGRPPAGPEQAVRITATEDVRSAIRNRADGMIWGMSQLPLITLGVTSLGVINTVLASIRARRWEMGVLRAIGTTRFGLFRLIIAEAILIGIVACLLSFVFGVAAGWCSTGVTQYVVSSAGWMLPWSSRGSKSA